MLFRSGLVGGQGASATVQESYALGTVTGTTNVGSLVGGAEGSVGTSFAFEQEGLVFVGLEEGSVDAVSRMLTVEEFADEETFTAEDVAWAFDDVWTMAPDRPVLQWQTE